MEVDTKEEQIKLMEMIEWKEQRFSDINTKEFYEIFKFRSEVFVVEQEILYNDFDYKDY